MDMLSQWWYSTSGQELPRGEKQKPCGQRSDFDRNAGNLCMHIGMQPNDFHFLKALENALSFVMVNTVNLAELGDKSLGCL